MNLKSNKGYSLVEIGVGLLILTVFLICSAALFNGCYNTYRMIQQRNLAINLAVSNMESLLQTDSNVLTGFFIEELDHATNEYVFNINSEFQSFVRNNFDGDFKARYARLNNLDIAAIDSISTEKLIEYIFADKEYLINAFIRNEVENYTESELNSDAVKNGDYALLNSSVVETGNQALLNPGTIVDNVINGEMAVRKTVTRLPIQENKAYGNNVLKIKVDVLYTSKVNTSNLTEDDVKTITLETIKIAG